MGKHKDNKDTQIQQFGLGTVRRLTYVQGETLEATGWCSRRGFVTVATAALQLAVEILGMTLDVTNVFDDVTDVLLFVGLCLVLGWCVPIMRGRPLGHIRAGEADGSVQSAPARQQWHQLNAPSAVVHVAIRRSYRGAVAGAARAETARQLGAELEGLALLGRGSQATRRRRWCLSGWF